MDLSEIRKQATAILKAAKCIDETAKGHKTKVSQAVATMEQMLRKGTE